MEIHQRVKALYPHASPADIQRWVAGGREYAERLDKLPAQERESVAQLFACYGLTHESHYKRAFRRSIDVTIRPFYPTAGVDRADT